MDGVIRTVVAEKGYGFIRGSDGVEYFFHRSGLEMTTVRFEEIGEGQTVAFTPIEGPKGPRAIEIRVTE